MQCFDQVTFGLGGMDQKPCKSFDLGLEMINGQSDVDIAEVDREIEVTRLVGPFSGFHSWLRVWVLNYHVLKPNAGPGFEGCNCCSSGTTWRWWWCGLPP